MTKPKDDRGKLTVPDPATQREVMQLWRMAVELDRQYKAQKPPRGGNSPSPGR